MSLSNSDTLITDSHDFDAIVWLEVLKSNAMTTFPLMPSSREWSCTQGLTQSTNSFSSLDGEDFTDSLMTSL